MIELDDQVLLLVGWATPQTRDHFPAHSAEYFTAKKAEGHGMANLNDQAALLGPQPNGSNASTEKRGALNPAFSRWLMGFPPEWDDCVATATPSSRKSRRSSSARTKTSIGGSNG